MAGNGTWKQDLPRGGVLTRIIWFFALGALLTIFPGPSANVFSYIAGGLLILFGIWRIAQFFRGEVTMVGHTFSVGLIAMAGGIVIVLMPQAFFSLVPILIGFAMIACAMLQLEMALGLTRMKYPRWYLTLISSVLMLVLGVVILINPFSTSLLLLRFIGIAMLIEAICDLIDVIVFNKASRASGNRP